MSIEALSSKFSFLYINSRVEYLVQNPRVGRTGNQQRVSGG